MFHLFFFLTTKRTTATATTTAPPMRAIVIRLNWLPGLLPSAAEYVVSTGGNFSSSVLQAR
jgi:hypothetical protein